MLLIPRLDLQLVAANNYLPQTLSIQKAGIGYNLSNVVFKFSWYHKMHVMYLNCANKIMII